MLVGFAEGLGAAKTYAARNHYDIDANRELLGLGGANLASGLSSGMVVNGSLSKTAVNGSSGARTQLSGLVVAVLTVVTLLLLTGLFESLPEATLAAIVIAAVIELVDLPALIRLFRVYAGRSRGSRAGGPRGLRRCARRDARRADLRHPPRAVHRHRACRCAAALSLIAARTWPSSARCRGRRTSSADRERHPENRARPGHRSSSAWRAGSSSPTPTPCAAAAIQAAAADGIHAVVVDAATIPSVDVTAAGCSRAR